MGQVSEISLKEKVRVVKGLTMPTEELSTSTFYYFYKVKHFTFSEDKDTAQANSYLLKVDPYYFMSLGQTPSSIGKYLSRYNVTLSARKLYEEALARVYDRPTNEIYTRLEKMYWETFHLKLKLDSVPTAMKKTVEAEIRTCDSVHFDFLFNYVRRNGWPDLEHGSIFASEIAERDVTHCYDYLPMMLDAFEKGGVSLVSLQLTQFNERYFGDLLAIQEELSAGCERFDISAMLSSTMPVNIKEIVGSIRKNCPIHDVIVVLESPRALYKGKIIGDYQTNRFDHFSEKWSRFLSEMRSACPEWKEGEAHGIITYWQPYDLRTERLTLYVIKKR